MDSLTEKVLFEIKRQYKSVRNFSHVIDIPQTTIATALKKGLPRSSFSLVLKICDNLNINIVDNKYPAILDDTALKILDIYNKVDEKGKYAIETVVKMEYDRYLNTLSDYRIAAFSGKSDIDTTNKEKMKTIANLLDD